ncbi:MAG: MFS transporter, partial [Microterricola sp.]
AAASGLLMLPMMAGMMGTSIWSGIAITKSGKYKIFPIVGTLVTALAMTAMTTLTAATPIWLICVYLFVFGAGLGLIMQVIVLVVQNAVDPEIVGTATSTNNYFREVGASLGVAIFGALFTTRLSENLTAIFTEAGATDVGKATATLDPQTLSELPEPVRDAIVNAYAESLAPVFWYLIPFILIAFVFALFLKQIPLSDQAGMVARGEAISGEEAETLEAAQRAGGASERDAADLASADLVGASTGSVATQDASGPSDRGDAPRA